MTRRAAVRHITAGVDDRRRLKTCKGYPHGMPTTHADAINADLLAFVTE